MYIVVQQGVYKQAIVGCFTSDQIAKKCAEDYANKEHDDYHTFEVYSFVHDIAYKDDICEFERLIASYRKDHNPKFYNVKNNNTI